MYEESRLRCLLTLCLSLLDQFSLPIFNGGFGGCGTVHVGRFDRVGEFAPEPMEESACQSKRQLAAADMRKGVRRTALTRSHPAQTRATRF